MGNLSSQPLCLRPTHVSKWSTVQFHAVAEPSGFHVSPSSRVALRMATDANLSSPDTDRTVDIMISVAA